MLAVAKTPRTELLIQGYIPEAVLYVLRREYGKALKLTPEPADELIDWETSSLKKKLDAESKPGDGVWVYRENRGWTQRELVEKLGVKASFVSDLENGRRAISKQMAKELAKIFKVSVAHFV